MTDSHCKAEAICLLFKSQTCISLSLETLARKPWFSKNSKFLKDACLGEIRVPSILSPPNNFIFPSSVPTANRRWMLSKARIDAVDGTPWWRATRGSKFGDGKLSCTTSCCWGRCCGGDLWKNRENIVEDDPIQELLLLAFVCLVPLLAKFVFRFSVSSCSASSSGAAWITSMVHRARLLLPIFFPSKWTVMRSLKGHVDRPISIFKGVSGIWSPEHQHTKLES